MSKEESAKKFAIEIDRCLKESRFKDALELLVDGSNDIVEESSWDIVSKTSAYIDSANASSNGRLVECCQNILNIIAEKCNPNETVLELLEQIDSSDNDIKFSAVFQALGRSFPRMGDKTRAIEWCTSTIRYYVCELSRANDVSTSRLNEIYSVILSFLEPLVEESALDNSNSEKYVVLRDYIVSVLIFLLGKPLCFLQRHYLSERILTLLTRVCGDLLRYLNIVRAVGRRSNFKKTEEKYVENRNLKVILFESTDNVPTLAYANLYYHVLSESNFWKKVPQVYSPRYIFGACVPLVNKFFEEEESVSIAKGLSLIEELLKRLERRSLPSEILRLDIYRGLFNSLPKIMIYSDDVKQREKALGVFREYIEVFDMQARYFVILNLYQTSHHSGLLSLITCIFKASIIECQESVPQIPYFLGVNFKLLLQQACKLPHGSASDLVELSDEVITSLNLLRFLFIRDRHNEIGIWDMLDTLDNCYLEPLREGINLCRAHWKVKVKDLEELKKDLTRKPLEENNIFEDADVTLLVGGEKLPPMPIPDKIAFCNQALNGLDVMESILIRVNECIANNPLKSP